MGWGGRAVERSVRQVRLQKLRAQRKTVMGVTLAAGAVAMVSLMTRGGERGKGGWGPGQAIKAEGAPPPPSRTGGLENG